MNNKFPVGTSPYFENKVDDINKCKAVSIAFYFKYYPRVINITPFTRYMIFAVNIRTIIIVYNK